MATAPYPTTAEILDVTRERCNDMIVSSGGQTLTNNAPFTLTMVNVAWQKMQQLLVSMGYVTLEDETIIPKLPAVATLDPAAQVSLSWTGYFNGAVVATTPVLPQSLIRPLDCWERVSVNSGTNLADFNDMDEIIGGGMDLAAKVPWQQQWQWRSDALWMPGARNLTDIRIRFAKFLPDFTDLDHDVAEIMRCKDALSGFIAVEFSGGRGDMDRGTLLSEAQEATAQIVGLDSLQAGSVQKTSEKGKMKDRYTGGGGA